MNTRLRGGALKKDFDLIGMGSVMVDYIHGVDAILGPESKGILHSTHKMLGGVVLNHLTWASVLGLRTALFGIGAADSEASFIRSGLDDLGIDHHSYLKTGDSTGTARIYVDPKGERAIYMNSAANALAGAAEIKQFIPLMRRSHMVSTEVSQIKLSAVVEILKQGAKAGCRTLLDLDVPPSQAVTSGLGTKSQLMAALKLAHVLKSSVDAAGEFVPRQEAGKMALAMHKKLKKLPGHWVALTAGSSGSGLSDGKQSITLPAVKGLKVKDSTGAGDAFFGGLIAGALYGLDLKDAGLLANAAGAANVQHLGASAPSVGGRSRVTKHYQGTAIAFKTPPPQPEIKSAGPGPLGFSRNAVEELNGLLANMQKGSFDKALALIQEAEAKGGHVQVTGIGKPEHVARYVASSYSSVGTPTYFLHGTEVSHGSAGGVGSQDVVIAISNSGETPELKSALMALKNVGPKIIGVSGNPNSWLARQSDVFLFAGVKREGDGLNMAPRASILAEILVLSALGVALQEAKKFSRQDFKKFHPGGALGKVN